jgi:hypothetical protein
LPPDIQRYVSLDLFGKFVNLDPVNMREWFTFNLPMAESGEASQHRKVSE